MINVEIKLESDEFLPYYATEGAAGVDLVSSESGEIKPHSTKLINTGIQIAVPKGYELQIRPRSGLALKESIMVLNSPGTIDSDYRGNVGVILHNMSQKSWKYSKGMRIAQAVLNKVEAIEWVEVSKLNDTERGLGGFGSTGQK